MTGTDQRLSADELRGLFLFEDLTPDQLDWVAANGDVANKVGTYSLAGGATEIAIHEAGHTAFGLADDEAAQPLLEPRGLRDDQRHRRDADDQRADEGDDLQRPAGDGHEGL